LGGARLRRILTLAVIFHLTADPLSFFHSRHFAWHIPLLELIS
jgi:hypothetical protein